MGAAIVAALKAIPALVTAMQELGSAIEKSRNRSDQRDLDEFKSGVRKLVRRIQNAETNDERRILASAMSDLVGK